jgi:hypothetical protein
MFNVYYIRYFLRSRRVLYDDEEREKFNIRTPLSVSHSFSLPKTRYNCAIHFSKTDYDYMYSAVQRDEVTLRRRSD